MSEAVIFRFRRNLRLADNAALARVVARGGPVIPVFVWRPEEEGRWAPGAASRWWLGRSLRALDGELRARGSRLIVRREEVAGAVEEDHENLLFAPGSVMNASGRPFQVFTAFWRACQAMPEPAAPLPAPSRIPAPGEWPASVAIEELGLEPAPDWAAGLRESWSPGEAGAMRVLAEFVGRAGAYGDERDRPDHAGTSRLSPHLHFGEISARQVWHATRGFEAYLRQLGWREFSAHLLHHFPHTATEPLRPEFRSFPWRMDAAGLRAWTRGRTGYPLVDAGMRELWHTGWMHNRVRMVAASFLVKHLLIPWQEGAAWFWDTLVDADLANNTMGWQWCAGCGADAAPYFRVFNPVLQGEKFDPEGAYVRRWVPELADVPARFVHKPWMAPEPPRGYPGPIVDHDFARRRALAAWAGRGRPARTRASALPRL